MKEDEMDAFKGADPDCWPTPGKIPKEITASGFRSVRADPLDDGIIFRWQYPNFGFGEVAFWRADGKWRVDTEYMSADFCAKMLEHWVKGILSSKDGEKEEVAE